MDWSTTLDAFNHRLVTVERQQRDTAQTLSKCEQALTKLFGEHSTRMDGMDATIQNINDFAKSTDRNFREACDNIASWYSLKSQSNQDQDLIAMRFVLLDTKLDSLVAEFQSLSGRPPQPSAGQVPSQSVSFAINTPLDGAFDEAADPSGSQQQQWESTVEHGGSPFRSSGETTQQGSSSHAGAGPCPAGPPTTHGPASQSTQAPAQDAPRYFCREPYQEPQRPTAAAPDTTSMEHTDA